MFAKLNSREKLLVAGAAILLPIIMLFYVSQYIYSIKKETRTTAENMESDLKKTRKLIQNLNSMNPQSAVNLNQASFLREVNNHITRNGLNPSSLNEKKSEKANIETYEIIVKFYKVDLLRFLEFLYDVEQSPAPISVNLLSIRKKISKNSIYDINLKLNLERSTNKK